MVAPSRIDTPEELLNLIELEMKALRRELSDYPMLKEHISLSSLERRIRSEVIHQAIKGGVQLKVPMSYLVDKHIMQLMKDDPELLSIVEANPNTISDREMEVLRFKSFYMKWAKNLIAELNRVKMLNKWNWMEVKPIAKAVAELSTESVTKKNECYELFNEEEMEAMTARNWDNTIQER